MAKTATEYKDIIERSIRPAAGEAVSIKKSVPRKVTEKMRQAMLNARMPITLADKPGVDAIWEAGWDAAEE